MNLFNKNTLNTIIVFLIFILPQTIYSIIPEEFNILFFGLLTCLYVTIIYYNYKRVLKKIELFPFILTILFIFFGILSIIFHKKFSFFNLLSPIVSYIGYVYYIRKQINLNTFKYLFVILYIYYFVVYYSILPDFFFRPNFDEDAIVFDNASSNAIPISLNITLYFYFILNRLLKSNHQFTILIISVLNLIAIIIQQSRGGLIISVLLVCLSFYNAYKKQAIKIGLVFIFYLLFLYITYFDFIKDYLEILGDLNGLSALNEDVRGIAQAEFFKNLNISNYFFGYPPNTIYVVWADAEIKYTYNVFLDIWNKYTIILSFILILILFLRFFFYKKYEFPIYYLLPFLIYSLIESLFFPNFWDAFIYLIIFFPKQKLEINFQNNIFNNNKNNNAIVF